MGDVISLGLRRYPLSRAITLRVARGTGVYIEYQPGNSTRYQLFFQTLSWLPEMAAQKVLGGSPTDYFLVSVNGIDGSEKYRSCVLRQGGYLDYSYLGNKLGCGDADAVVLAEVIAKELGCEAKSSEEVCREWAES